MEILDAIALGIGIMSALFGIVVLLKIKPKTEKKPKAKKIKAAKKEKAKTFDITLEKETAASKKSKKKSLFSQKSKSPEPEILLAGDNKATKASSDIDLDTWEQNK